MKLTEKQEYEIEQLKRYLLNPRGMASTCGIVKTDIYPTLKYVDKTKNGVCFSLRTIEEGKYENIIRTWARVEIGKRGKIYGEFNRVTPIEVKIIEK